jgi:hypothetical protein
MLVSNVHKAKARLLEVTKDFMFMTHHGEEPHKLANLIKQRGHKADSYEQTLMDFM